MWSSTPGSLLWVSEPHPLKTGSSYHFKSYEVYGAKTGTCHPHNVETETAPSSFVFQSSYGQKRVQ